MGRLSGMGRQETVGLDFGHIYPEQPSSANKRPFSQTKTTPEGVAFDHVLYSYDFFLLATPIKPIKPVANSQIAAGMGIALTSLKLRLSNATVPLVDSTVTK